MDLKITISVIFSFCHLKIKAKYIKLITIIHLPLIWLLFYVLATCKVISAQVLTCNSAHSWQLYSAAPLGDQATNTMTWYPKQSHYPDAEPTSPWHSNKAKHLARKWQVSKSKSLVWLDWVCTHTVRIPRFPKAGEGCLLITMLYSFSYPVW